VATGCNYFIIVKYEYLMFENLTARMTA